MLRDQPKERPVFSIIVATFNASSTLNRCLDSIANQDCNNYELIIVDGGSTDGTREILQARTNLITYWQSAPDDGIFDAWNQGLAQTSGEWICFLGADDRFWSAASLQQLHDKLPQAVDERSSIVYGKSMIVDSVGNVVDVKGEPWSAVRKRFRRGMCLPHPGMLHHRRLFERHGNFDTGFRIAGDYEFLLRELTTGNALFVSNATVTAIAKGGVSDSTRHALQSLSEARRARQRNNVQLSAMSEAEIWVKHWASVAMSRLLGRRSTMNAKRIFRQIRSRVG